MSASEWREYGVTYPAALVAKAWEIHNSDGPGRLPWEAQTDAIKAAYIIMAHNHFQEEPSMSIEQQAAKVIRHWMPRSPETWDDIANAAASNLAEKNLLAPEPHIIRTIEQLEALDPDAVLLDRHGDTDPVSGWLGVGAIVDMTRYMPASVIATGEQVRAARKALEDEA